MHVHPIEANEQIRSMLNGKRRFAEEDLNLRNFWGPFKNGKVFYTSSFRNTGRESIWSFSQKREFYFSQEISTFVH